MPMRASFSPVLGPTPHSSRAGLGCRKASSRPGSTTCTPDPKTGPRGVARGLASSVASFARNLTVATPIEHVSPSWSRIRARMSRASRRHRCDCAGPPEHQGTPRRATTARRGGDISEHRHDPSADLGVVGVIAGKEHGMRAQPTGPAGGHRRVDAVTPGDVAGSGDDPAVAGAADDDRLRAQLRSAQQLTRHEEGVHVDVHKAEHPIGWRTS